MATEETKTPALAATNGREAEHANVIDPRTSVVTELQLSDISDDVGTCWRELGPKLDIPAAKIQNLDDDYRCARDKANALLLIWKQKEGSSAVAERLAYALESIGKKCIAEKLLRVDDVPKGHVISLTVIHELGAGLDKHMVCVDAQGNKYTVKPFNSSDKLLNLEETNIGKRFLETVVARQESLKRYISSELQDLRFQMKKGLLAACGNVGTANRTQDASKENIEPTSSSFNEEVGPPNDESVEELLQTCEEHRNFFQKMFEALIKMTAEVAQQNEDDVNCIQQLLDYAKELRQEEKALFSKIESTCTHNQLSDEKHADRTEELQKWKTQHEVQFKEVEKLLSGLLNAEWKMERGLGNKERPPSRQKSLQERMSKYLPGYGRKSPISRRYSECDLPKETGAKLSHQKSLPEGISKSLPEYGGKSPRRYSECDPPKETGAKNPLLRLRSGDKKP
ncbi:uncharacterized protein LOC111330948 isoform X2 [Stylophora pistillata]|uniref:uncharacterized protein LOC111330948 isoform X2 n=1 Tax=Stylophora pistillata TaxID=50429 RepID=UPI000C0557F1|nr:uncharacterized protein LOC111330948 isoform X2 [Stylophora pistillata]